MNLNELKLLYVCTDFPYPPVSGGLVDMCNRIQALHSLGVTVDLIATVATEPGDPDREKIANYVRRLIFSRRERSIRGLLSLKPGQAAIRSALRRVELVEDYDVILMQTEFVSEILRNKTLKARVKIVRVDNNESAYYLQTAKAESSWLLKFYYLQEAIRVRNLSSRIFSKMNSLWFVSHDELELYRKNNPKSSQRSAFVPTAINLGLLDKPPLEGNQVLFVGNLWAALNRQALEWYINNVHSKLSENPAYRFVIVGSTRGRDRSWLGSVISRYPNILAHFDVEDLTPFYKSSTVFVNPMQNGAGVKLKTIEAVLRGLPVVSTQVGAEGSGLVKDIHYKCADTPAEFAEKVMELLNSKKTAHEIVRNAQSYVLDQYDQPKVLGRLLLEAVNQVGLQKPVFETKT